MDLVSLVKEAMEKDSDFAFKINYWVHKRKKVPHLAWLMPLLEKVLGKQYVKEQAQKYIESQSGDSKE